MINGLVQSKPNSGASSDAESRGLAGISLSASVATDIVAGDIGDRAVVVGVQTHVLVVSALFGAVDHKVRPAVVGEGSVGESQQAARRCKVEVHI